MKDKRFQIVGEVENIDIPDVEEENSEKTSGPKTEGGFKFRVNKDKVTDFISELKKNNGKLPMPSKKDLEKLAEQSGINEEKMESMVKNIKEFMETTIDNDFIDELEKIVDEKGLNITQSDIDKQFDKLFESLKKKAEDDEEEEEEVEFEMEINTEHSNGLLEYPTLAEGQSYGMVSYNRNPNLLADFKAKYGDLERYDVKIFVPEIRVSNATPGLANIRFIDLVEANDKFILFKGIPGYDNMEPMYIGVIQFNGEFEMVIPEYGNSFEIETGDLFTHEDNASLFLDTPMGKILMQPADLKKIKTGLDLVLFEPKKPSFSIRDFGAVIPNPSKAEFPTNYIHIGDIISNDSEGAILFKKDFDIPVERRSLDFFVKLKKEYSEETLDRLSDYIVEAIDFNDNSKIITQELKYSQSGGFMYIDIDLGDLPDYIDRWYEE